MPKENIYTDLYDGAKNGEHFTNLMPLVLSSENILLAYRNIKNNDAYIHYLWGATCSMLKRHCA